MSKHTNEPRHEKNDDDGLHLRTIPINRIVIGKDHRSHDADAINDMSVSIREVGVITPVVVTHAGKKRRRQEHVQLHQRRPPHPWGERGRLHGNQRHRAEG